MIGSRPAVCALPTAEQRLRVAEFEPRPSVGLRSGVSQRRCRCHPSSAGCPPRTGRLARAARPSTSAARSHPTGRVATTRARRRAGVDAQGRDLSSAARGRFASVGDADADLACRLRAASQADHLEAAGASSALGVRRADPDGALPECLDSRAVVQSRHRTLGAPCHRGGHIGPVVHPVLPVPGDARR